MSLDNDVVISALRADGCHLSPTRSGRRLYVWSGLNGWAEAVELLAAASEAGRPCACVCALDRRIGPPPWGWDHAPGVN